MLHAQVSFFCKFKVKFAVPISYSSFHYNNILNNVFLFIHYLFALNKKISSVSSCGSTVTQVKNCCMLISKCILSSKPNFVSLFCNFNQFFHKIFCPLSLFSSSAKLSIIIMKLVRCNCIF